MEIRKEKIKRLLENFKKYKNNILMPGVYEFNNLRKIKTETGDLVYTIIGNRTGWYSVVRFFNNIDAVEIYDMHVFKRYQERYLRKRCYDKIDLINQFLERNSEGTIFLEDNDKISKKVKNGACLGSINKERNIVYNKTFISDIIINPVWQSNLKNVDT